MKDQQIPIQDCRIFDLQVIGEPAVRGTHCVLMGSGSLAKAQVEIPNPYGIYYVYGRSRYARIGLEFRMLHDELRKRFVYSGSVANTASILIHNWGRYSVLLREGDSAVAIADYLKITQQLSTTPHSQVCPEAVIDGNFMFLSIGNQRTQLVEGKLPLFPLSPNRSIRYVDPQDDDLLSYTETTEFKEFCVRLGDFFVVNTREYLRIPRGEVGVLYSVTDDFLHSSALLIYPGSEGHQALEFQANCQTTVAPGMEVMTLTRYLCPEVNGYNGRYASQNFLSI